MKAPAPARILMTADTVGGVWTYALELARALAPRGTAVTLATMGAPPSGAQRAAAAAVPGLSLRESAWKLEWMDDPWEDVAAAGDWLLALRDEVRPDLVHVNGYAHGALTWRAPVVVVAHSCVLSWWQAVKGEPAPERWDRYRRTASAGLRSADLVVAPTRWMLSAARTHFGPLPEAIVIHNGRDPARLAPAPKEPFVLSAGRLWDEAKNLAALDRIAPRLPWPVVVAGDPAHPDGRVAAAANARALGALSEEELAGWLARAAIYALPARYEPFGLSVLEAALAGCALVLGDLPSLREVWEGAAVFVPPSDHEALRVALTLLIGDRRHRDGLARRARERALALGPERMVQGYLHAYRRAAEIAAPRAEARGAAAEVEEEVGA